MSVVVSPPLVPVVESSAKVRSARVQLPASTTALDATVDAAPASGNVTIGTAEASRFLSQVTQGANWEEIHRTAGMGLDDLACFVGEAAPVVPVPLGLPSGSRRSLFLDRLILSAAVAW